jgi:hypothetical protein
MVSATSVYGDHLAVYQRDDDKTVKIKSLYLTGVRIKHQQAVTSAALVHLEPASASESEMVCLTNLGMYGKGKKVVGSLAEAWKRRRKGERIHES